MVSAPPALPTARQPLILAICSTAEPTAPVETALGSAFLGGALALASLLFVGGGFRFARRTMKCVSTVPVVRPFSPFSNTTGTVIDGGAAVFALASSACTFASADAAALATLSAAANCASALSFKFFAMRTGTLACAASRVACHGDIFDDLMPDLARVDTALAELGQ